MVRVITWCNNSSAVCSSKQECQSYWRLLDPRQQQGTPPAAPTCMHVTIHCCHHIEHRDLRIIQMYRGDQNVAHGCCLMELVSLFVLYFKKFYAPLRAKNIPVRTFISCTKIVDRLTYASSVYMYKWSFCGVLHIKNIPQDKIKDLL